MIEPNLARDVILAAVVTLLGAAGTFLVLPHRHGVGKSKRSGVIGGVLLLLALAVLALFLRPPSPLISAVFHTVFSLSAVAAAAAMIASRDPVHSALWFAVTVLSTAGLFLLAGAQFLAAGTVIVYAGAIIVMFLFVIMLAQQQGRATYDRMSRNPKAAVFGVSLLLWTLLYAILAARSAPPLGPSPEATTPLEARSAAVARGAAGSSDPADRIAQAALAPTARLAPTISVEQMLATLPAQANPPPHVAALGGTLYSDHVVSVLVAAALLFVSMVGAVAIIALPQRGRSGSPEGRDDTPDPPDDAARPWMAVGPLPTPAPLNPPRP